MSELGELWRTLADAFKLVFREFVRLAKSPWEFRLYSDAVGAPPLPTDVLQRMEHIAEHDISPQTLADAMSIIEGIRDAFELAFEGDELSESGAEIADRAFEATLRMFLPIMLVCFRRSEHRTLYLVLAVFALVDDKLADQMPGFTGERLIRMFVDGASTAVDDQTKWMFVPYLMPLGAWLGGSLLDDALGLGLGSAALNAGWESDLPTHKYGVEDPPRPTPVWMAQRTTSVHWSGKPKPFRLARYADPPASSTDERGFGVTVVPVPAATDEVAAAPGGPAMWLQFDGQLQSDVDLGRGVTFRLRGHSDAGTILPLVDLPSGAGVGGGVEATLSWTPDVPPPDPVASNAGGESGGAAVSLGGASLIAYAGGGLTTNGIAPDDLGVGVRLSQLRIAITPKSAVLGALVRTSLTTSLDVGLFWSKRLGLVIEGGSGLDLYLALRRSIGNGWLGATLSYVRITGILDKKPERTRFGIQATMGLELSFLRATLILDGLGAGLFAETRKPNGNLLGLGHLDGDAIVPSGIGLKLDWGPVKGGGYFSYDKQLDRYSGAVEVGLGSKWALRGVGFCEPQRDTPPLGPFEGSRHRTSTLITATFEQDIPSPGFTISGFGFLFALHRRSNPDAMRDALPSGAIDAVLFPSDPLGRTAEIVASLATMFPAASQDADTHVFGVLLKGSFAGGYATVKIGFLFEFGTASVNLSRVLVPFSLKAGPGGALAKVFSLEVLGLGHYDPSTGDLEITAVLRNSRLCGGDLVGGLVVFHGDPDPDDTDRSRGTFVSVGGYHPSYYGGKGPRRARVDQRLGIVIARGQAVKLEVSFYLAFVPAGFHLGVRGRLFAQAAGFGIDGQLWLDGVTNWTFDDFTLDVGGSVALILFSRTLTELRLEGELQGQTPWRISGSVSFKVAWWSVSKSFSKNLTDEPTSTITQALTVQDALVAALNDPLSYPRTAPASITLTRTKRDGIWNAPEQPLTLVQKTVPFDIQIDRVGRTPLATPITIHLDNVTVAGGAAAHDLVTSEFAPAAFLSLDADAAVRAPVAEIWPAGFTAADDVIAGDDEPAAAMLDEITIDSEQLVPRPKRRLEFPLELVAQWRSVGIATPALPIRVRPAVFASRIDDAPSTFGRAWAGRGRMLRRTERVE
jgi:hypothetical protein